MSPVGLGKESSIKNAIDYVESEKLSR
jgi:hypothetical protein